MAFFGVTLEEIETVSDHPNADRLSVAKMKNLEFQFVTGKNQFKCGDKVLYFPVDSVLPEDLLVKINMIGKLSGTKKNRVKVLKLRNFISQGLVIPPAVVLTSDQVNSYSSEEITKFLKVEKYEPPFNIIQEGILTDLPSGFSKYDIEGCERYGSVLQSLMDQEVLVSEKMEGTNFSVCKDSAGKIHVNQRDNSIIEKDGVDNWFWTIAKKYDLINKVSQMKNGSGIYAEVCGPKVQKNIYNLKEMTLFVFDIKVSGKWLNVENFLNESQINNYNIAPVLFQGKLKDFLNGRSIQDASNGKSIINPSALREGIVIKPINENWDETIGRIILKQRSPQYLASESED